MNCILFTKLIKSFKTTGKSYLTYERRAQQIIRLNELYILLDLFLKAFLQEFVCFIQHKHPNAVCSHYAGLYQLFYSPFKISNQSLVEYKILDYISTVFK